MGAIAASPLVGVVAPVVRAPDNSVEDHARRFPSIFTLLAKVFGHRPRMVPTEGRSDYRVDWIAGMFMLFRSDTLRSVGGFDERYFLYYEDVGLCARLHERGLGVAVNTAVSVRTMLGERAVGISSTPGGTLAAPLAFWRPIRELRSVWDRARNRKR